MESYTDSIASCAYSTERKLSSLLKESADGAGTGRSGRINCFQ